ncbi:MAG: hypothetical protein HW421_1012 [Ignavibacteria bacterium]|nr:hypothetical protein [Ignavibacteria bacterium]
MKDDINVAISKISLIIPATVNSCHLQQYLKNKTRFSCIHTFINLALLQR